MWKYYAFRIAGFTLSHLPKKIGYFIACIVADTVYMLSPAVRSAVANNVMHVLGPEADSATLGRTVRGVLRNAAKNYIDLIKIPHMGLNDIESCTTIHGWHNLDEALRKGKGVILVSAHLGSFDMACQILAVHSIRTTVLMESLQPPSLLDHVTALRSSHGIHVVPAQPGVLEVLKQCLRRNEVLLLACDRSITKDGLKLAFFGKETVLPTVAVLLAMRTEATVVPAFSIRREDGRYDIYVEPAVDIARAGNGAVAKNMEQITSVMERYIKAYPEQWVVISPIWE